MNDVMMLSISALYLERVKGMSALCNHLNLIKFLMLDI